MPTYTATTLLEEVRDYADEPDDNAPATAYITDEMVYRRLSSEQRRVRRMVARAGVYFGRTSETIAYSAVSSGVLTLAATPMVILGVYHEVGNGRRPIAHMAPGESLVTTQSGEPRFWDATISASTGATTLTLYPSPTQGNLVIHYVPEPSAITGASTVFLPDNWKDAMVLGAAMRCYTRANGSNSYLKSLYQEALLDVEADAAQATDYNTIRNTDAVYVPGIDNQARLHRYDPADFWWSA